MTDLNKITKKKFESVYNKHLPNGWIRFAYKYFSNNTEKKDMSVRNSVIYPLIILFLVGFIGTAFKASKELIGIVTICYSIILAILVLYLFSAVFLNNARIKTIAKELGITKEEYNKLVEKLYE